MGSPVDRISITGFKSIQALEEFPLRNINLLIGANGAGKSNFVEFFRMLRAMADEAFQTYVTQAGGGDSLLHLGPKVTPRVTAELAIDNLRYRFVLKPAPDGGLYFDDEAVWYHQNRIVLSGVTAESVLKSQACRYGQGHSGTELETFIYESLSSWVVYHFHDTSPLAPMRRDQSFRDNEYLRADASNIAAFLYALREHHSASYDLIRETVRLIAPFFDDFVLRPETKGSHELVRMKWRQKGSDFPFQPYQLSDGTLRFICLATCLQQPELPSTVLIDEPELGLHPYAITLLADLIKSAAARTQVIISTQSPILVDHFEAEQVVVVSRESGQSQFHRLSEFDLEDWLREYSLGELWLKDVIRGGPTGG